MRRHAVLTHVNWPVKRFIYATGPEALWLGAGLLLALVVWRAVLPLCVGGLVPVEAPDASPPALLAAPAAAVPAAVPSGTEGAAPLPSVAPATPLPAEVASVPVPSPASPLAPRRDVLAPAVRRTDSPLLLWGRPRVPGVLWDSFARLVPWVPFLAAGTVLLPITLVVLWEPEEKKLHRWALAYVRRERRLPRVATYQPRARRGETCA